MDRFKKSSPIVWALIGLAAPLGAQDAPAPAAMNGGSAGASADETIVEIAAGNEAFETLVAAVRAAGLVETLNSEGPFTVFAPTDEAFAALPEGALEGLLADPEALRAVLTYHVVAGRVMASDVVGLDTAEPVGGGTLDVRVRNGTVWINDATVVQTDITASNGVIHVIDKVLLPPMD